MAFATCDTQNGGGTVYEPYAMKPGISAAANLRQAFAESTLLAMQHRKAVAMLDTPVMLVPEEEFDDTAAEKLYRLVNTRHTADKVVSCVQHELGAVAVFAMNADLHTVLTDRFTAVEYIPLLQPVWQRFNEESQKSDAATLFAYMHDKQVDLMAFRRGRFRMCTTCDTALAEDAVYYIMAAWRQLAMRPAADRLRIAGTMPGRDRMMAELRKFVADTAEAEAAASADTSMPLDLQLLHDTTI